MDIRPWTKNLYRVKIQSLHLGFEWCFLCPGRKQIMSRLKILKMQISPGLSLLQKHDKARYTGPGCNWKSSCYHTPANAALMILFKIWRVRSISYDMLRIPKLGKVIGPLELGTGSHSRWSGPDHHLQASFSYHQYLRSSFVHSLCKLWTFCCVAAL